MELTLQKAAEMMAKNNGSLYLSGCTGLTSLPDGLTVGGGLYLSGCTGLTEKNDRFHRLHDGDYVPGRYLYADGVLTHVKRRVEVNGYDLYIGKITGRHVVSDGQNYAHCRTFREGIADLRFKSATDRGADQYRALTLDSIVTVDEAKTMYRVITGACNQGTEQFVASLGELQATYTVREMIELTRGQYGADKFAAFFEA